MHASIRHLVSLSLIVAFVTGCQTPTHERTFLTVSASESPKIRNVRFSGQYRLYSNAPAAPTTQNATPILEARLAKDDLLGFAAGEGGRLLAIIRSEQRPLPSAHSFTWTMQPDAGQYDPDRTAIVVLVVVVAGIAIAVGLTATIPAPFGPFN